MKKISFSFGSKNDSVELMRREWKGKNNTLFSWFSFRSFFLDKLFLFYQPKMKNTRGIWKRIAEEVRESEREKNNNKNTFITHFALPFETMLMSEGFFILLFSELLNFKIHCPLRVNNDKNTANYCFPRTKIFSFT